MIRPNLARLGRVLIIVNPVAQNGAAADAADRLQRFLTLYCHREAFDVARTERPGHATGIAEGAGDYDTVLALGGDGVVHEVANGLMRLPVASRPVLGVVPVGSGNDFARTLGLTDIADVSGTDFSSLLASEPGAVDVMRVTYVEPGGGARGAVEEYAVQTASFGLDAAIAIDTHAMRRATGLSGMALYLASGIKAFGRGYRDYPVGVRVDSDERREMRTVIFAIQNGPTYGSGFEVCPEADATDGLLDVCFAEGPIPRALALPLFLSAKNGGHARSHRIHFLRASAVELDFAQDSYPIQLDGERIRATSMRVEAVPGALRVLKASRA